MNQGETKGPDGAPRYGAVARLLHLVGRLHQTRDRRSGVVLRHARHGVSQQQGSILFRHAGVTQPLAEGVAQVRSRRIRHARPVASITLVTTGARLNAMRQAVLGSACADWRTT